MTPLLVTAPNISAHAPHGHAAPSPTHAATMAFPRRDERQWRIFRISCT
ncbi:hypothetical protein [Burkholderia ubonensis]|nr:hypothetical protein [Burkholderia ubonensis]